MLSENQNMYNFIYEKFRKLKFPCGLTIIGAIFCNILLIISLKKNLIRQNSPHCMLSLGFLTQFLQSSFYSSSKGPFRETHFPFSREWKLWQSRKIPVVHFSPLAKRPPLIKKGSTLRKVGSTLGHVKEMAGKIPE